MSETTVTTSFSRRVRSVMKDQNLSVRGLARKMDPQNVERARRNLHRWLDEGMTPHRSSREEVASALGIHESELASDDDEESDPVADLMLALERMVDARLSARERV